MATATTSGSACNSGWSKEYMTKVELETNEGEVEVTPTFDTMGLQKDLLWGIYAYRFEKPLAIQQWPIQQIIKRRDVLAWSQSGTGKTATFSISVLQCLDIQVHETQALILAPTRELAMQIQKGLLALGYCMKFQCHACIGDTKVGEEGHQGTGLWAACHGQHAGACLWYDLSLWQTDHHAGRYFL